MSAPAAPIALSSSGDSINSAGKPVLGVKAQSGKKAVVISMAAFAVMNVTTIVSLRGMP